MQARTVQYLSIAFFVSLLVWGVYVTLVYLGIPIHGAVFLTDAGETSVKAMCGDGPTGWAIPHYLCRGAVTFAPFLLHAIGRAAPFLWYFVISILLYGGFAMARYLRDGDGTMRVTWKPWKVLAVFLLMLWLLFTTLSFGTDHDRSVRMYVEPTAESYNVGPEAMQTLQADFQSLQSRGCLAPTGQQTPNGTKLYTLRVHCIQFAFVTRVLAALAFVLVLLFEMLVFGRWLLSGLGVRFDRPIVEVAMSAGVGAAAWIVVLWFAAVFGVFNATTGWALAVAIPAVGYRHVLYWIDRFLRAEIHTEWKWYDVGVLLVWLLLGYIALNFLNVVRPFPIGWDDLGSYLNRPRLLVSYGYFIHSMASFDWGYLTALGYLLFGYQSAFGATASMMVNWTAGLLAVLGVFALTQSYLGSRSGYLAALLYYSLPLVGHFSFADMKIDNAVFFFGTLSMFAALIALFPPSSTEEEEDAHHRLVDWRLLLLAGLMGGFSFAAKVTGIMAIVPIAAILAGVLIHWSAFVGSVLLSVLLFARVAGLNVDLILDRVNGTTGQAYSGSTIFLTACVVGGLLCFAYALYRRQAVIPIVRALAFFGAGFLIAVAPWVLHNNILLGNVIPQLALGAPNNISPVISARPSGPTDEKNEREIRSLPPELALDPNNSACQSTGHREEIDRYWGFAGGWSHYLTLPWRTVMNLDSVGYYVTTIPALLLFPLVLLLPYVWTRRGRWLRWLSFATLFMVVEWMFLANGIPWYGIGVFLGLCVGLAAMAAKSPDTPSRVLTTSLLTLSLFCAFSMRFWQFEQQRSILEYSFGKVSANVLEELTIPHYNDIKDVVLERTAQYPDRPYLYRVGTFIPYFIPKNLEIIGLSDHQLDMFNCLFQERDAELTTKRFRALGFNAIIFDTNTATIEQDPNGSLHKKVYAFEQYLNDAKAGIQVPLFDKGAGVGFIIIP